MSSFEGLTHRGDSSDAGYETNKRTNPFKNTFGPENFNLMKRDNLARQSSGWKKNPEASLVQASLVEAGFDIGPHGIDGIIGNDTKGAIEKFQAAMRFEVTGELDGRTRGALELVTKSGLNAQQIRRMKVNQAAGEQIAETKPEESKEKENKPDAKNETVHHNWKEVAFSLLGKPYQFDSVKNIGPHPPQTFDCSSLTQWVYKYGFGVDLPRTVAEQWKVTEEINQPIPGCLVIFNGTYDINKDKNVDSNDKYTHVGIWLGDNQFLQAASKGVTISTFNGWYKERFDSFRVLPGLNY